jgi:hypothetical protein
MDMAESAEMTLVPHPTEVPVVPALEFPRVTQRIVKNRKHARVVSAVGSALVLLGLATVALTSGSEEMPVILTGGLVGIALLGAGLILLNRASKH